MIKILSNLISFFQSCCTLKNIKLLFEVIKFLILPQFLFNEKIWLKRIFHSQPEHLKFHIPFLQKTEDEKGEYGDENNNIIKSKNEMRNDHEFIKTV